MIIKTCLHCKKDLLTHACWVKRGGGQYCSRLCKNIHSRKQITYHPNEYRLIKNPSHHRANPFGFVYEHIIVAENKIRRPLFKEEHVHHINGNPSDNDPANLLICKGAAEHMKIHADKKILAASGNPSIHRICGRCKQVLLKTQFSPSSSRGRKCLSSTCKPCRSEKEKTRQWQLKEMK